jgi:hypothetical protein
MRRAATVLLLSNRSKTRGGSFDVLMVKRHSKARFMANTYVFPGGCVRGAQRDLGLSRTVL